MRCGRHRWIQWTLWDKESALRREMKDIKGDLLSPAQAERTEAETVCAREDRRLRRCFERVVILTIALNISHLAGYCDSK